ncbi:MAG: TetR/AcrR family transcriptional regulator [Salinibacterium sp.]|nr:TetR/AcrR family transcriptional regulator [Salinibacterium sp.]
MDMNSRTYSMTLRGAGAHDTRRSILSAAFALVGEKATVEIILAEVAARAGVTVKTILRHFGSREGLFDAVTEFAIAEVAEEREAPVGDIPRAIQVIVDHYEKRGDWVIRMLAQELSDDRIHAVVEYGRTVHQTWVTTTFAPQLARVPASDRDAAVDGLIVALDVYAWKLLRRDRGLDRDQCEQRMRMLVEGALGEKKGEA